MSIDETAQGLTEPPFASYPKCSNDAATLTCDYLLLDDRDGSFSGTSWLTRGLGLKVSLICP